MGQGLLSIISQLWDSLVPLQSMWLELPGAIMLDDLVTFSIWGSFIVSYPFTKTHTPQHRNGHLKYNPILKDAHESLGLQTRNTAYCPWKSESGTSDQVLWHKGIFNCFSGLRSMRAHAGHLQSSLSSGVWLLWDVLGRGRTWVWVHRCSPDNSAVFYYLLLSITLSLSIQLKVSVSKASY